MNRRAFMSVQRRSMSNYCDHLRQWRWRLKNSIPMQLLSEEQSHSLLHSRSAPNNQQHRCFGKEPPYWLSEDVAVHDLKVELEDDDDEYVIAPLVVCGPPGVGTRAIIKRFLMKHSDKFGYVISHTNRSPRRDEENGIDYHFISDKEMEEMIFWEDLFEHSTINGKIYGTAYHSIFTIHGSGGPPRREIIDVDMYGVKRFKEIANSVLVGSTGYKLRPKYVFIAPPDLPTLRYRLTLRNTESEQDRERLLEIAEQEVQYGMSKAFHARVYHVDLEQAVLDFTDAVASLYDSFAISLTEDLDPRDPDEGKQFRRKQRNNLIMSLDKDAINPIAPQDSRLIRQARRKAWLESQKNNDAAPKQQQQQQQQQPSLPGISYDTNFKTFR
jgi:guanylate kinase